MVFRIVQNFLFANFINSLNKTNIYGENSRIRLGNELYWVGFN